MKWSHDIDNTTRLDGNIDRRRWLSAIMFREDASKVKNGGCLYASYTGKHFLISDMSVWRYVEVFIMKAQYSARKLALTDITIISSLY